MPYLKFSRDRRGYESTYLLHAGKRQGASRPHLLYWFRTPPHVKVGRAAFDEDAIRQLEDEHPDVSFDWAHILQSKPPAVPEPRDGREARESRPPRRVERKPSREIRVSPDLADRQPDRASRPGPRHVLPERPPALAAPSVPVITPDMTTPSEAISFRSAEPEHLPEVAPALHMAAAEHPSGRDPDVPDPPRRRFVRVFDAGSPPSASAATAASSPARRAADPTIAEQIVGPEQLTLLRARHAEILARISARGGDAARVEALREQAERANPDTWVTESEVRVGLAQVDAVLDDLHRIVGRRRRRRRRPGQSPEAAPPVPGGLDTHAQLPPAVDLGENDDGEDEDGGAPEDEEP